MNSNFGVVTACWKGDYFLVKATCASIRHFLGDVPICVIVDGNFSIQELEKLYGVQPLYLSQLSNPELRRRCPGSSRAKLAAIWEGPFEHFLYLDSDAIIWGNLLKQFELNTTDFVVMRPPSYGCLNKHEVSRWFFDVDSLLEIDPTFEWQNQPYFCAGAFAAKRNCFDLQEYLRLEALGDKYPDLFKFWDQGIVNYLVFSSQQQSKLNYTVLDIQLVTADYSKTLLEQMITCKANNLSYQMSVGSPKVIHFCGNKPFIHKRNSFSAPFTNFRLIHYQNLLGYGFYCRLFSWFQVWLEEGHFILQKAVRKLQQVVQLNN